jgi:tRNA pseudouridine(38-40) synthase
MEWIPTRVVGQSFLLHQIHKMVSLAVDVARGLATRVTLEHALESEEKVHVSLAPAQGMFLDMSIFDSYN